MSDPAAVLVREEHPADRAAIRQVNVLAFGRPAEADLVDELRRQGAATHSLVAERAGVIVGHVLFSPVTLRGTGGVGSAVGLGPLAVRPDCQRRGIGSALVRAGLERCRQGGQDVVVVVGHREYYPRFGFAPAHGFGLRSEYPVPPEAFMVVELAPGVLAGVEGVVVYHPAFGRV